MINLLIKDQRLKARTNHEHKWESRFYTLCMGPHDALIQEYAKMVRSLISKSCKIYGRKSLLV